MIYCCVTFLIFSYQAAIIIYLILDELAFSGNATILIEHSKQENKAILSH